MRQTLAFVLAAAGAAAPSLAQQSLNDNFDCYAPGAPISAQPGWELWPWPVAQEAFVTDTLSFSGSSSLQLELHADVVRQFNGLTGVPVTFIAMTYVPSSSVGMEAYFIALSQYDGGGAGTNWLLQVRFDSDVGTLTAEFRGDTTPLIFDRWVEWRAEIDFTRALYDLYYDGMLWAENLMWQCGTTGCGPGNFAAIDLYVHELASGPGMYIDDIVVTKTSLTPPPTCGVICYADCDASGATDLFDFLCFQNLFAAGDPRTDCDGSGALDLFDFLCFQNEFAAGCS